ncbi:HNH endonuclease [Gordonia paraffinivorans]|uniref:HNH endonuclease n=1 Tax=Gordonia paraffinivorans TaxID=175628 RepID=UPI001444A36C|nr:HNH endonuclease signature motif containing protein [Gordonia paraffinivorans]
MSWEGSSRRERLPKDWESNYRLPVLRRDSHRCQVRGPGCLTFATDVDHIRAGDDHSLENLQAICPVCHRKKSSREGNAKKAKLKAQRRRPPERHPGRR